MHTLHPVRKTSIPDVVADQIIQFIAENNYKPGDRLPTTMQLAETFEVGYPSLREAIKKLETMGALQVKHGSGIYVGGNIGALFYVSPIPHDPTKKILLDHMETMAVIEPMAVKLAAQNAMPEHIDRMSELLSIAESNLDDRKFVDDINMQFHRMIGEACGNVVLKGLLQVMSTLFKEEEKLLTKVYRTTREDFELRLKIFDAIKNADGEKGQELMKDHLRSVYDAIKDWEEA